MKLTDNLNNSLSPQTIRSQAARIFDSCEKGGTHFSYHPEKWDEVLEHVENTILENYPDLNIPEHGRYVHFRAGEIDRLPWVLEELKEQSLYDQGKSLFDLVVVSVLLDAGAGDAWRFKEEKTGQVFGRSEGLGVASVHMFLQGGFSSQGKAEVSAQKLINLTTDDLSQHFQVSGTNPLLGLEGRVALLNNLGKTLLEYEEFFPHQRVSDLMDSLKKKEGEKIRGESLLQALLLGLGHIWPGRIEREGVNLGDVWHYPPFGPLDQWDSLIPFHKLSQWLSYSLLAPMRHAGLEVTELDQLTGLPEYRNGGLFVDGGLLELRNLELAQVEHSPSSELIVEWRALTIQLLDLLAAKLRKKMNKNFPLVEILEGGTWWAGRRLAAQKRDGGGPPLKLKSDGTVF